MKSYKYKKVDAFTSNGSKGNPAAFMLLKNEKFSDAQFLAVAKEHAGFICEFVFVNDSDAADLKLTYYSSECEINFCGHGTIATLYELIGDDKNLCEKKEIKFETNKKGVLSAYNYIKEENAIYVSAPEPVFYENKIERDEIAAVLGIKSSEIADDYPVSIIDAGLKTLIIPIKNFETEISVYPDIEVLKKFAIDKKVDIFLIWNKETAGEGFFAHTRVFSPKFGYLEDPATGSGNSAFANYLLKNQMWNGEPIAVEQGGKKIAFNKVNLRVQDGKILFGGSATVKIEGEYFV